MSVQCDNVHSARTISFSLTNSSKVSFFSWVTSEAVATAAAASRPQAIFLTEGIVVYLTCLKCKIVSVFVTQSACLLNCRRCALQEPVREDKAM